MTKNKRLAGAGWVGAPKLLPEVRVSIVGTGVSPEQDPDVQLMLAVQQDSSAAFEALFRKYIGPVVAYALSFVGSRARAEELAQEAFVQLFRTRRLYQPRARFSTFLYRIVTNVCLSEVRRAEYRSAVRTPEHGQVSVGYRDSLQADLRGRTSEDDLLVHEQMDRMHAAIMRLPAQQRAALLLARVEGLSYEEVADSLKCSVSAVKSLIHRATLSLRNELKE